MKEKKSLCFRFIFCQFELETLFMICILKNALKSVVKIEEIVYGAVVEYMINILILYVHEHNFEV